MASSADTLENTEGAKSTAAEIAATTVTVEIVVAEKTERCLVYQWDQRLSEQGSRSASIRTPESV